jgi:hypothetical protein
LTVFFLIYLKNYGSLAMADDLINITSPSNRLRKDRVKKKQNFGLFLIYAKETETEKIKHGSIWHKHLSTNYYSVD